MSYPDEENAPPWFQELPWLLRQSMVSGRLAPEEWLASEYTARGIPDYFQRMGRVGEWGFLAPSGLAPLYAENIFTRMYRAGYIDPYLGGGEWTYGGRTVYYEQQIARQDILSRVYGTQPSWAAEATQRYRVGQAYWEFQEQFTPAAIAWSAARLGTYLAPELGAVRAFGFPFFGGAQRFLAASAVSPYTQGLPYEQFLKTSAGWTVQPPTWGEQLVSGIGTWTAAQVGFWGLRGGLESYMAGGGFAAGAAGTIRQTLGWSLMQPGIGMMVDPWAAYGSMVQAGYGEQAAAYLQSPEFWGMEAVGAGLTAGGYLLNRQLTEGFRGGFSVQNMLAGIPALAGSIIGAQAGTALAEWLGPQFGLDPFQQQVATTAGFWGGSLAGQVGLTYGAHALGLGAGAGLGATVVSGLETLGLSAVGLAAGYGMTKGLEMLPGPVGTAARTWENILFGGPSVSATQFSSGIVNIPGMTESIIQQPLRGLSPLYAASGQAWNLYGALYGDYSAAWDAYRAKTIDYSTVAFMGGLSWDALTAAREASTALGQGISAAYGRAAGLARELGSPFLATYYGARAPYHPVFGGEQIPGTNIFEYPYGAQYRTISALAGLRTPYEEIGGIIESPAAYATWRSSLQATEQARLADIYGGLRERGWQGMGALTRQLETADILTGAQRSQMLGMAYVAEREGVGGEWSPSAMINLAGAGLTGVWRAAAGDPIAAAALNLALTGRNEPPPGYSVEDVRRLRDYWEETGQLPEMPYTPPPYQGPNPYAPQEPISAQTGLDRLFMETATIRVAEKTPEWVKVTQAVRSLQDEISSLRQQLEAHQRQPVAITPGFRKRMANALMPEIAGAIYRESTAKGR